LIVPPPGRVGPDGGGVAIVSRRPGRGRGPEQQNDEQRAARAQHGQAAGQDGAHSPDAGQGQGKTGPGWGPVRDSVRRDVELALTSLAFAERMHEDLDAQRRLFIDFPHVTEELRSGALERLAGALERLFEGGVHGSFDLPRFLRDLPLALGHLAAAEAAARRNALAAEVARTGASAKLAGGAEAHAAEASQAAAPGEAPAPPAAATEPAPVAEQAAPAPELAEVAGAVAEKDDAGEAEPQSIVTATAAAPPAGSQAAEPAAAPAQAEPTPAPAQPEPISPRVELRTRMLTAAPQLAKAAQAFRRNAATVRRSTAPRRQPGPWRSDKEVLEQARRAVEFAARAYDTYAEAWADAPLPRNLSAQAAAEADRFLAWTQLARYTEVARAGSPQISQGPRTHEAAPGVKALGAAKSEPPTEAKPEAKIDAPEAPEAPAAPAAQPETAAADAQPSAPPEVAAPAKPGEGPAAV
jgi:hypothetical protein